MDSKIDYRKVSDSISFYQNKGFSYIESPWCVSDLAMDITRPEGRRSAKSFLGNHVASAEQSFLQLILDGKMNEGSYISTTPCYRDEKSFDELHHDWFLKSELIHYFGKGNVTKSKKDEKLDYVLNSAESFFSRYLKIKFESTPEGIDIVSEDGTELGSYGFREFRNFSWVYGTGVAEPRLSYAINKIKKSYHNEDIPKGIFGEASKIYEEVREFEDSLNQQNPVMGLMELSDLLGAVEKYVEQKYANSVSFEDLVKMKNLTKRVFRNGHR